jgi:hypothetical protein
MTYFNMLCFNLPAETEKDHETPRQLVNSVKIQTQYLPITSLVSAWWVIMN